jgi:MoaA/NifB/PqqE/SkfB family radical SAM enzyme
MDPVKRYDLCRNPLLKAVASIRNGRIKVEVDGPLSHLPKIRSSLDMIDGQVPVQADEGLCISTWFPPLPGRAFDRFVQSRIKSILGIRTPDQVTISITEECPNRCQHCALPDTGERRRLEPEAAKNVIGQILDLGTTSVIFDGGEPTLYRELPELVEAVDDRAIATLFTSGTGFTADLARRLKDAGLYAVNVSLDSPLPQEHDFMRGRRGAFDDATLAIKSALSAGLLVDIYAVLRRGNIDRLQGFHDLARLTGAHELTFFEVVPVGRWAKRKDSLLSAEDHAALESFVSRSSAPRIFSVPAAFNRFGCFAGQSWMHITPAGEVYPCACMPRSCGSIFGEPLAKIWRRMGRLPYRGSKVCPMRKY